MSDTPAPGLSAEFAEYLSKVAALNLKPVQDLDPVAAREQMEWAVGQRKAPPPVVAEVEDRMIPGRAGDIPIRIYRPEGHQSRANPALLFFHGGGHVIGSLFTHDVVGRNLCQLAGCIVVSVDYRMGPEHRFPAAVEDSWDSLIWLAEHGAEIGVDTDRIAVGGDSAGGNLAAVVAIMARDAGGPTIRHQSLIYPLVDYRCEGDSYRQFATGYGILEAETMLWFRKYYLRDEADQKDWRASPLLAADLSNLPPAHVVIAGCDVLRDEGRAYADALKAAGNMVSVAEYDGAIHAFFPLTGIVSAADEANRVAAEALTSALA